MVLGARPTIEKEITDDESQKKDANQPECSKQQEQMQIDYIYDPWQDQKNRQLFLPSEGEHPMDAIARRIDLLLEACTSPEGYKMVVEGGDPYDNCTELDKIKILDKCLY